MLKLNLFTGAKVRINPQSVIHNTQIFCAHTTLFWLKYQKSVRMAKFCYPQLTINRKNLSIFALTFINNIETI